KIDGMFIAHSRLLSGYYLQRVSTVSRLYSSIFLPKVFLPIGISGVMNQSGVIRMTVIYLTANWRITDPLAH
ncbi:MAG: hypothetical protein ACWA5U_04755, partial [bacterium]